MRDCIISAQCAELPTFSSTDSDHLTRKTRQALNNLKKATETPTRKVQREESDDTTDSAVSLICRSFICLSTSECFLDSLSLQNLGRNVFWS